MDDKKLNWKDLLQKYVSERTDVHVNKSIPDMGVLVLDVQAQEDNMLPRELLREFLEEVSLLKAGQFYSDNHALVMPGNSTVH